MGKIFVTLHPVLVTEGEIINTLQKSGHEIVFNTIGRKLKPQEIEEKASDCSVIIAGTEDLTLVVQKSPQLRLICRVGVGLDSVPLQLCREKDIKVTFTPDAVTYPVAELTVGLMIDLLRHLTFMDKDIRAGNWVRPQGRSIMGSTIGVVGAGRIGSKVVALIRNFEPREILVYDPIIKADAIQKLSSPKVPVKKADFNEALSMADVITLHLPKTAETANMFDKEVFRKMKPNSVLINTSRGGIINETDLFEALENNLIAGAALDVFESEPYSGPLTKQGRAVLTQHVGTLTEQCRYQMETEALENALRFFSGKQLQNEVSR